jgi:hypothetical protein
MKKELIVLIDLGSFKAYEAVYKMPGMSPQLGLIESLFTDGRKSLKEQTTDVPGYFSIGRPNGINGMRARASGEQHNLKLELQKRIKKQLADKLNKLVGREEWECWHFAASKEIYYEILERLDDRVKSKLKTSLPRDLTKVHEAELLARFLEVGSSTAR